MSTDYDPLPPPPPARPASAVGWAYDEPKGSASVLAAPKARALPAMVEEDADSEVAAVTARLASAPLPPSAALAAAARAGAPPPAAPMPPLPLPKPVKTNVSYSFLVPPAPAMSESPGGASEANRKAAQEAKYAARAAENEHLYGDRACAALPTRAVRRGCLNPIVDCVAPAQVRARGTRTRAAAWPTRLERQFWGKPCARKGRSRAPAPRTHPKPPHPRRLQRRRREAGDASAVLAAWALLAPRRSLDALCAVTPRH